MLLPRAYPSRHIRNRLSSKRALHSAKLSVPFLIACRRVRENSTHRKDVAQAEYMQPKETARRREFAPLDVPYPPQIEIAMAPSVDGVPAKALLFSPEDGES